MDDASIETRLAAALARLEGLRGRLRAAGPWPLADRIDHAPEASWGPREVLAHLEEMLPFWLGELERVIDAPDGEAADGPPSFGRLATDEVRLAILARDRSLPVRELLDRVEVGIGRWQARWPTLTVADRARIGRHVTLGDLDVTAIAARFVAGHLEDHLDQLEASLTVDPAPG